MPLRGAMLPCRTNRLAGSERTKILVVLDAAIKFAQELTAVPRVIFPGVCSIEKKRNGERLIALTGFAGMAHPKVQVRGGGLGVDAAVNETDQIGQVVIAEQAGDAAAQLQAPGFVEAVGVGGQAVGIAKESDVQGPPKYAFICSEPLETFFGCESQRLIRYRTFRRPEARRLRFEHSFMVAARPLQLFASIFRAAIRAPRQSRPGSG